MELSKDLDLNIWRTRNAATCYMNKQNPTKNTCMFSVNGDTVCQDETSAYFDGAAAILNTKKSNANVNNYCGYRPIESFVDGNAVQKCVDGTFAVECKANKTQ